jgi:ABC-2 type transport system ATP-binding protein
MESMVLTGVCKAYGNRQVLKEISFSVKKGTVHGFLGPNGAGKSTTMKIMAGILSHDRGEILIDGHSLVNNLEQSKSKIGILPENPPLYKEMVVTDYLLFVCQLYSFKGQALHNQVSKIIDLVGLGDVQNRMIGNLSKGYQQKVGVAQALVSDPEILLLDEPTIGLDPTAVRDMRSLIQTLGEEKTILLSSHLLHEVGLCCEDITIIHEGEILRSGTLKDIQDSFKSKKMINIQIQNPDPKKVKNLLTSRYVDKIENISHDRLKLYINTDKDVRSEISKLVIENQMGLLEFVEESLNLEEVFLNVTKQEGNE